MTNVVRNNNRNYSSNWLPLEEYKKKMQAEARKRYGLMRRAVNYLARREDGQALNPNHVELAYKLINDWKTKYIDFQAKRTDFYEDGTPLVHQQARTWALQILRQLYGVEKQAYLSSDITRWDCREPGLLEWGVVNPDDREPLMSHWDSFPLDETEKRPDDDEQDFGMHSIDWSERRAKVKELWMLLRATHQRGQILERARVLAGIQFKDGAILDTGMNVITKGDYWRMRRWVKVVASRMKARQETDDYNTVLRKEIGVTRVHVETP